MQLALAASVAAVLARPCQHELFSADEGPAAKLSYQASYCLPAAAHCNCLTPCLYCAVGNLDSTATSEAIRAEFSRCGGVLGDQMVSRQPLPLLPLLRARPLWPLILAAAASPTPHLFSPPGRSRICRFGPLLQWQVAPPKLPGNSNLRYAIVSFRKLADAEAAFNALNKQVWVAPACRL